MVPLLQGAGGMVHLVAKALPGHLLFRTHAEAAALFRLLARAFPDVYALCVMPDHVHLVAPHPDAARRLAGAMSAYARWRNHARGERGRVWAPHAAPEPIPDARHLRRTLRYVHLNPCRAGLAADPLAWPWSTHRDATGFAVPPVRPREPNAERFHGYVSSDPTVAVAGTALPVGARGPARWETVRDAVSAVCRVPVGALGAPGPARTLALRTAWHHGLRDTTRLADAVGIARSGVYRVCTDAPGTASGPTPRDAALAACVLAVGDARFAALPVGDLRIAWPERYRRLA